MENPQIIQNEPNFTDMLRHVSEELTRYDKSILFIIYNSIYQAIFADDWDELPLDDLFEKTSIRLQKKGYYCFHLEQIIYEIMRYFNKLFAFDEFEGISCFKKEMTQILWSILARVPDIKTEKIGEISAVFIRHFENLTDNIYFIDNLNERLWKEKELSDIPLYYIDLCVESLLDFLVEKELLALLD